jgi:hypothetical protein
MPKISLILNELRGGCRLQSGSIDFRFSCRIHAPKRQSNFSILIAPHSEKRDPGSPCGALRAEPSLCEPRTSVYFLSAFSALLPPQPR